MMSVTTCTTVFHGRLNTKNAYKAFNQLFLRTETFPSSQMRTAQFCNCLYYSNFLKLFSLLITFHIICAHFFGEKTHLHRIVQCSEDWLKFKINFICGLNLLFQWAVAKNGEVSAHLTCGTMRRPYHRKKNFLLQHHATVLLDRRKYRAPQATAAH